jgi:4-alpha-glucanotransferase
MIPADPFPRSSGVLLHPTSLPGPFGVGDLGPVAHKWVETLARAGQRWWQVLPVGPTGYGDSPYQSPSTFAGNPNLISPEVLAEWGLVSDAEVAACELPHGPANYEEVIPRKRELVRRAWERFQVIAPAEFRPAFKEFFRRPWLAEFAWFMAIKEKSGGKPWWEWPAPFTAIESFAIDSPVDELADELKMHAFAQFLFARQWAELREHAHRLGVKIIGDLPIYVAHDSADVWANPDLFLLDADRNPVVVAGVPPDYFAATGQLWGNPIYDWGAHRRTGFRWWADRLGATLEMVDLVRLDHFRGLEGYWAVPFGDQTAERGEWRPGPGADILTALRQHLGGLPIIAEDLGFITPEVDALREQFRLPGMRILQFAFGGAVEQRFSPHRFDRNVAVYTGTHDNNTTRGWYDKLTDAERENFTRYTPDAAADPVRALVRLGWSSVADLAVTPVQDLLGLGSEARLNTPGTAIGNWRWRLPGTDLGSVEWVGWLRELTETYERSTREA